MPMCVTTNLNITIFSEPVKTAIGLELVAFPSSSKGGPKRKISKFGRGFVRFVSVARRVSFTHGPGCETETSILDLYLSLVTKIT